MNPTLEQVVVIEEEGKLKVTITSNAFHKGDTVKIAVSPHFSEKGKLSSLFGAAKGCFSSEKEIDDFINHFRGE